MLLATSRYQDYRPEWGVAVRITVGRPRFFPHPYGEALSLAPYELFQPPYKGIDNIDVERRVYRERLERYEQRILAELTAIADRNPGKALILLCFENVNAGQDCHRRWAAEWFSERFGWVVPEIPTKTRPQEHEQQGVLF